MEVDVFVRDGSNRPDQRQPKLRARLGVAVLCALTMVVVTRPATAQQRPATAPKAASPATTGPATPATQTASTGSTEIVCDSVAAPAAPRKVAAARPRKVRKARVAPRVAAAPAAPKPKPTVAVAHARKRRPATGSAAGHRAAKPVAAKATTPPRCHSVAAAATPEVGAVQNLVSSLPWTAPAADATFPVASAPTLAELGGIGLRTGGTLAAGLLGAGAFWLKSGSDEESRAVVPPNGPGPGGPETPGGPNGPPPITTVPEPATLALVASGLAAIGARTRRRRTR